MVPPHLAGDRDAENLLEMLQVPVITAFRAFEREFFGSRETENHLIPDRMADAVPNYATSAPPSRVRAWSERELLKELTYPSASVIPRARTREPMQVHVDNFYTTMESRHLGGVIAFFHLPVPVWRMA